MWPSAPGFLPWSSENSVGWSCLAGRACDKVRAGKRVSVADAVISIGLVSCFAAWATLHVSIVAALASRARPSRALVALVLAPLGAYWALKERMHMRVGLWLAALLGYAAFWIAASSV
jgi:hypothetical protein